MVRDLDDTISSLFSYLAANSPGPSCGSPAGAVTRGEDDPSPFRSVAGVEAASRSLLITPPGSFHAISGDTPPPLPERGPPCEAAYKGYGSPTSPSPSQWLGGHPGGARDRKSVISSKASSDIELVNLCRSGSERRKDARGGRPGDDAPSRGGRDTASDDGLPSGPCSSGEARRGEAAGAPRHAEAAQDSEDEGDGGPSSAQQPHARRPTVDHHYSEIDIYGAAQDTAPSTASASPVLALDDPAPPPVPPHVEGKDVCCVVWAAAVRAGLCWARVLPVDAAPLTSPGLILGL